MENLNFDTTNGIEELKRGSPGAFRALYKQYFRLVEDLVLRLHGRHEDAQDVFQDALIVLVGKLRKPGFVLSSKLSTFLYAIARNIWLKKIGKTAPETTFDNKLLEGGIGTELQTEEISPAEKDQMIEVMTENLNQMEEGCRALLLYAFFENCTHEEIAGRLGYTVAFVKVKKYRCLEYLRIILRKTDVFIKLN